jgi:hypothetical protein
MMHSEPVKLRYFVFLKKEIALATYALRRA